jgi:hypothetical protein
MKDLKEFDYFKAWLLFFFIGTVGGALIGLILGSFVTACFGGRANAGHRDESPLANYWPCYWVTISYITFRAVIGK